MIAWWEEGHKADNEENLNEQRPSKEMSDRHDIAVKALALYVMIDPQHGWTRSIMDQHSTFDDQVAWLDGPFGSSHRLEEYSTVLLFASGNGVAAQLPLLKVLATQLTDAASRIRRVKLVWQSEKSNEQLQKWMHEILRDEKLDNDVSRQSL